MITIFSPMRPFHGTIGEVQRSAIRSWLSIRPACEVLLVDDEEGTTAAATNDLGVRVLHGVERSPMGAPLLGDLLRVGAAEASHPVLAYITADVLLPPNFADVVMALDRLMADRAYFAIAGRYDMLVPFSLDFDASNWFSSLQAALQTHGRKHRHTALDLWVYRREFDVNAPPMPIGRGGTDGWAVWSMRRQGIPVVDLSDEVLLVHQHHDKPARKDPRFNGELRECVRLFESMAEDAMSLLDANWLFSEGRLRRPRGLRRLHAAMSLFRPYRFLLGLRRRYQQPHIYGA